MPSFLRITLLVSLCFLVACLSSRSSRDDDDSANDDDAANDDDMNSDDDDMSEEECFQLPDTQCLACMQQVYPDGANRWQGYVEMHMYCGSSCSSVCTSVCDELGPATETCEQCVQGLDNQSPDGQQLTEACSNDPLCLEFYQAASQCFG